MLRLEDVHTFYGHAEALRGVEVEVGGEISPCMIGNNGAGKSTTLMTISGVSEAERGKDSFSKTG